MRSIEEGFFSSAPVWVTFLWGLNVLNDLLMADSLIALSPEEKKKRERAKLDSWENINGASELHFNVLIIISNCYCIVLAWELCLSGVRSTSSWSPGYSGKKILGEKYMFYLQKAELLWWWYSTGMSVRLTVLGCFFIHDFLGQWSSICISIFSFLILTLYYDTKPFKGDLSIPSKLSNWSCKILSPIAI